MPIPSLFFDNQSANGKAFEHACAVAIVEALQQAGGAQHVTAHIAVSAASLTAARRFAELAQREQHQYKQAADAAARLLQRFEARLRAPAHNDKDGAYTLHIQTDSQGEVGDVRDLIIRHAASDWECGVSIKQNNDAAKHPRLAARLDFARGWFNRPTSERYFARIKPIFDELEPLAIIGAHWDSLGLRENDKQLTFYKPVLEALIEEIKTHAATSPRVAQDLLRFFIGKQDFYKIIAHTAARTTELQAYSFAGTLNQTSQQNQATQSAIKRLASPTKIISAAFKSNSHNTVLIHFDYNWSISLRLHNASSRVERSLKLDVRLTSAPPERLTVRQNWTS